MSKFEQYLIEKELVESINLILEALGHVDDVDAHDLGLPAFKNITADMIASAVEKMCKSGKCDVEGYMKRLEKAFKGRMSIQDREQVTSTIKQLLNKAYWSKNA